MATTYNFTYGPGVEWAIFKLRNAPPPGTPANEIKDTLAESQLDSVSFGERGKSRDSFIYAKAAEIVSTLTLPYSNRLAIYDSDKAEIYFLLWKYEATDPSRKWLYSIEYKTLDGVSVIVEGTMSFDGQAVSSGSGTGSGAGTNLGRISATPANRGKYPPVSSHGGMSVTGGPT
jgi:hypothetical protein